MLVIMTSPLEAGLNGEVHKSIAYTVWAELKWDNSGWSWAKQAKSQWIYSKLGIGQIILECMNCSNWSTLGNMLELIPFYTLKWLPSVSDIHRHSYRHFFSSLIAIVCFICFIGPFSILPLIHSVVKNSIKTTKAKGVKVFHIQHKHEHLL